ncbi:MAG: DsbA family oxidoreductase [Actinomycetes bacterium]
MLVEVWSDVVCPWCAIGRAHLTEALDRFEHADEVEVVWRSFELDPHAPTEREGEYAALLAAKYGISPAEAQGMIDRMTQVAAGDGLDFRFDRVRPGNTFDAHRLLHLALERGVQDELKVRLFEAYLTEGEPIGDRDTLARLAGDVGLDADEVAAVLDGERYADAVRADEAQAREYGISGVPFFVLDGRFGVSGAQPADVLLQGLRQAHATASPLAMVGAVAQDHAGHDHGTGDACADGSCAV